MTVDLSHSWENCSSELPVTASESVVKHCEDMLYMMVCCEWNGLRRVENQ
jgi:hypothetical protein